PVRVRSLEKDLLAGEDIECSHRVVGAAASDELVVWRPTHSVDRVERNRNRQFERSLVNVPELNFPEAARIAASGREHLAVGGERNRLNTFRQSDKPADEATA